MPPSYVPAGIVPESRGHLYDMQEITTRKATFGEAHF